MRQTSSMGNMMCLVEGSIIAGAGGSALGASGVSAVDELLTLESRSAMVGTEKLTEQTVSLALHRGALQGSEEENVVGPGCSRAERVVSCGGEGGEEEDE